MNPNHYGLFLMAIILGLVSTYLNIQWRSMVFMRWLTYVTTLISLIVAFVTMIKFVYWLQKK